MPEGAVIDTVHSNYLDVHGWLVDTLQYLASRRASLVDRPCTEISSQVAVKLTLLQAASGHISLAARER